MARKRQTKSPALVAHAYRFGDMVALYAANPVDSGTLYLSAADARQFAEALIRAAESIETESFIDSDVPQFVLTVATMES